MSKLRTYKESPHGGAGVSSRTKRREKSRRRRKKCERLENQRAGQKWRKEAQKGDERGERKGSEAMRANIVTEAAQNEKGQEGEEREKQKGDTPLASLREHICTGRHKV